MNPLSGENAPTAMFSTSAAARSSSTIAGRDLAFSARRSFSTAPCTQRSTSSPPCGKTSRLAAAAPLPPPAVAAVGTVAHAADVGLPIFLRKAEPLGQVHAHLVAVERLDVHAAPRDLSREHRSQGGFASARQAGEPNDETTLRHFLRILSKVR